eukprot:scaffold1098_cov417-Prasinococcus_capsulatus_cf.AAC.3
MGSPGRRFWQEDEDCGACLGVDAGRKRRASPRLHRRGCKRPDGAGLSACWRVPAPRHSMHRRNFGSASRWSYAMRS